MKTGSGLPWMRGGLALLPLCVVIAAGCSKPPEAAPPSAGEVGGDPAMQGGGMQGGGRRGGGGRGGPVAANATGAEIYQARCGCHGPNGQGNRAPSLTASASRSDADLIGIIHNGKGKMPAFAGQLTDDQIKKVVADIKQFK